MELLSRFVEGFYCPLFIDFPSLSLCDGSVSLEMRKIAKEILQRLQKSALLEVVEISEDIKSASAVAGLLLFYPIIYYSNNPHDKLLGADVTVFSVVADGPDSRSLMQFSCPPQWHEKSNDILNETIAGMASRIAGIPPSLRDEWHKYTSGDSCTLRIHTETRNVPILSL